MLALEPIDKIRQLLAERCGCRRLAVGAREHGLPGMAVGEIGKRLYELLP
jgi:hypothetical protein